MNEIILTTQSAEQSARRIIQLRDGITKAIERLTLPGSSAAERSTAASLKKVLARDEKEAQR
jgi:hypothetical protein